MERRLTVLRNGVPNQGDNIKPFVIPAFELLKDCGMIEKRTIQFLSDKEMCDNEFDYPLNSVGGVIRCQGLPMHDKKGHPRYYFDGQKILYVSLAGVRYYISNNWWETCKKRFFEWLSAEAWRVCKERWEQGEIEQNMQPTIEKLVQTLIRENKELIETNKGLCFLVTTLDRRIEILEGKIDELKRIWDN